MYSGEEEATWRICIGEHTFSHARHRKVEREADCKLLLSCYYCLGDSFLR